MSLGRRDDEAAASASTSRRVGAGDAVRSREARECLDRTRVKYERISRIKKGHSASKYRPAKRKLQEAKQTPSEVCFY